MSREIVRDAILYLPARVVPALAAILAVPVLTRLMSPQEYGFYLLAQAALTMIGTVALVWLVSVILRFHAISSARALDHAARPLLGAAMLVATVSWLVVTDLTGPPFDGWAYRVAGVLWLAGLGGFEYFCAWLRVRNRAALYSTAMSLRAVGSVGLAVTLLATGLHGGVIVIAAWALVMLACTAAMLGGPLGDAGGPAEQTNLVRRQLLVYGIPAAISNGMISALSLANRYVVDAEMGTVAVAAYGASYDIAEKTIFFANSMLLLSTSVIGTRVFEREGESRALQFLTSVQRFYLRVALPVVALMAGLAPQITGFLLPAAYRDGAIVLPLVAAAGLLFGIMHRYSLLLSFHHRTAAIMWCSCAAVAVNLGSSLLLVPRFGLVGAAAGTVLGYGSMLLFVLLAAARHAMPRFPFGSALRCLIGAGVAIAAMRGVVRAEMLSAGLPVLLVAALAGTVAYGVVLLLLREISLRQLREIAGMVAAAARGRLTDGGW